MGSEMCIRDRLREVNLELVSGLRWDYPLNLSISLSGGEENNRDAPSNGE